MIKVSNEGSSNPPVTSKGDRHGKPRVPEKAGMLPGGPPVKPTAREESYGGKDRVGK